MVHRFDLCCDKPDSMKWVTGDGCNLGGNLTAATLREGQAGVDDPYSSDILWDGHGCDVDIQRTTG